MSELEELESALLGLITEAPGEPQLEDIRVACEQIEQAQTAR